MDQVSIPTELIKSDPLTLSLYLDPGKQWSWFHNKIAAKIMDPKCTRLVITLSAQHYKSTLVMRCMLNVFANNPDTSQIAIASYSGDLAKEHSYDIQKLVQGKKFQSLYGLKPSNRIFNMDKWSFQDRDGMLRSVGVGGSIFGKPVNHLVLDDLIKPEEVYSEAIKVAAERWYRAAALSRLQDEHSKIICIGSRVGDGDFIGNRIEEGGWEVINIPAMSTPGNPYEIQPTSDIANGVPLLKSKVFYLGQLKEMTQIEFEAQFQGITCPRGSLLLTEDEVTKVPVCPDWDETDDDAKAYLKKVRGWDVAWTDTKTSDQTASALMIKTAEGYWVKEVRGFKAQWKNMKEKVKAQILLDDPSVVQIIETNSGGEALVSDLKEDKELTAYNILGRFTKRGKYECAMPWMLRAKEGKIKFMIDSWNAPFYSQINHFTENSTKDDLIDPISRAWEYISRLMICPREPTKK